MTDRDTFAAAALTGLLANAENGCAPSRTIAIAAYHQADAMLRERSRAGKTDAETVPEATKCTERETDHDALLTIESALGTLSRAIGVYGRRINNPFSVQWSNGIAAFVNGTFVAGGRGNVARAIAEHGMPDMRKSDATNHDAAPAAKAGAERPMSLGAAQSPSESDAQHPSAAMLPQTGGGHGTGNTQEPVAWAVIGTRVTGSRIRVMGLSRDSVAEEAKVGEQVVPLYRAPTLTAEERVDGRE